MDYHIKNCSQCAYSLPVTWTDKKEMLTVLRGLGWFISAAEVYCPECWRGAQMAVSKTEHYCSACGFSIVTNGPYHPTCPLCGEPLGHRKPTSAGKPAENKAKCKGEKNDGKEIRK